MIAHAVAVVQAILTAQAASVATVPWPLSTPQPDRWAQVTRALPMGDPEQGSPSPQYAWIDAGTTQVDGWQISHGMTLSHQVQTVLRVSHGDPEAARFIRDAIVADLLIFALTHQGDLCAIPDPAGRQDVTRVEPFVDYRPLDPETTDAFATITWTVRADVQA